MRLKKEYENMVLVFHVNKLSFISGIQPLTLICAAAECVPIYDYCILVFLYLRSNDLIRIF